MIERSLHDPEIARAKYSVAVEVSRVLRQTLTSGIAAGALPATLNVDLAIAGPLGPFLYRRLLSQEPLTGAVVVALVDSFLSGTETGECRYDDAAPVKRAPIRPTIT